MRVVFMGTPTLAATILESLAETHEVVGVYTRADAVRGRGSRLTPSPVKEVASARGLAVHEPRTLRDPSVQQELAAAEPDVVCVAAYGKILPASVLSIPRLGCINVHASLLPRWRGAAPIEHAILAGDERTGVSIMRMEEGLDTGPYCLQRSIEVGGRNAEELTCELARLGAEALPEALELIEAGSAVWTAQDDALATYAAKIDKEQLFPSPNDAAFEIVRKVRASGESHPARTVVAGRPVAILRADLPDAAASRAAIDMRPGEVRLVSKRLLIGCADGAVELLALKPDGKKETGAAAFAAGIQNLKRDGASWGQ